MIDIDQLRRLALDGDLAAMQEIVLRLKAAEKERDDLKAKIEQMEKQVPVGTAHAMPGAGAFTMACFDVRDIPVGAKLYALPGAQPASSVPDHKTIRDLLNESGLCAYDREGDLAFMVAATKFAALAAAQEAKPCP